MKRFRFRLEPVLTVRNWEEERAKTAYGQALQQELRIAGELRAVEVRIEDPLDLVGSELTVVGPVGGR